MILITGTSGFAGHKTIQMCPNTVACSLLRAWSENEIRHFFSKRESL